MHDVREPDVPSSDARSKEFHHWDGSGCNNDHFDPAAVRELVGERGQVICPASMAVSVASRGFRVRPVELFAPETIDDFTVTALPASDGLGIEQVSWMISRKGHRIIHCGDTLWHGSFRTFGQSYGPFDFAFLPVNGARIGVVDERGPGPPDVMPPDQAVYAAAVLGARVLVPIHYGMSSTLDYVEHPAVRESVLAASHRTIPRITVRWLSPGESTAWMTGS